MNLRAIKLVTILLVAIGLVGCAQNKKSSYMDSSMRSASLSDRSQFYGEDVSADQEYELLANKVLYFDYDRFSISDSDRAVLMAYTKQLVENPNLTLKIAGHTDERGSRPYNVALGERRANSIAKFLIMNGVESHRVATISYGKEQPVSFGHDEQSWKMNRRAELEFEELS